MAKRNFSKTRKAAIAALCAVAVTCTGLAAACSNNGGADEDSSSSTTRKEDNQLLRNGDFEYFDVPEDAVYLIRSVNNWSRSGNTSASMSGIINTSETAWAQMTDWGLRDILDTNNDLSSSDADYEDLYVDYNGMDSGDIPYIDPYAAALAEGKIGDKDGYAKDDLILSGGKMPFRSYKDFLGIEGDDENGYTFTYTGETVYYDVDTGDYYFDEEFTQSVRYATIENPQTHLGEYREDGGKYYLGEQEILVDEDGNYYIDENGNGEVDELTDRSVGNVLMVHNYSTSNYNGIGQHYSSQSIKLEANTAAEISVWVKTSNLKFAQGYRANGDPVIGDQQDLGAYIEVTQTVSSTTVDSFKIKAINTEKIIKDNAENSEVTDNMSNGWLHYTIYVNACDFADSTISINLGLGGTSTDEQITGYAFFDDIEVKKYISLDDEDTDCTYSENKGKIFPENKPAAYCALTSETEDKIFYADKQLRNGEDDRFSTRFHYLVDLASENYNTVESQKNAINFGDSAYLSVTAALTSQEVSGKLYASAETTYAKSNNITLNTTPDDKDAYDLPDSMKYTKGRPTFNDMVGIYDSSVVFSASDFGDGSNKERPDLTLQNLSSLLNPALSGENGLSAISDFCLKNSDSMIVMLSAYGASYTTTLENAGESDWFTVKGTNDPDGLNYKIISFWVKTSDMNGKTAATFKLIDVADDDNTASFTIDTTDITTDIGDNENIYSDWVQCFFFVSNETEEDQTFKMEFSFGNTSVATSALTSFAPGWAAMANMQTLDVDEDVFNIVSEGSYSKILTFSDETPRSHTPFDEANRMSNIKKEVGTPSNYYGVNGGSGNVTGNAIGDVFDKQNGYYSETGVAGLINRDYFENYSAALQNIILSSFIDGATEWNKVFGENCYQPLIIVDSLREYYDTATEDRDVIKESIEAGTGEYYVKSGDAYVLATEYNEDETYYTAPKIAKNYGFIGSSQTVSANSYKTVSVRVLVSGDEDYAAYVYLVDTDTASKDVMTFDLPTYTFYYDEKGNVLSEEFDDDWTDAVWREKIVYTLRDDGLYNGEDGLVYANFSNLTSRYKYPQFEQNEFYKEDGSEVLYDDLEDGVTYYSDEAGTTIADHFLCVDNSRVYEYVSEDDAYYYLVEGKRDVEVHQFDVKYARYDNTDRVAPEYAVEIKDTNGEWVTVNFIIQTGNQAKNYRLELWSGERGVSGEDRTSNGSVAFDYSYFGSSITDDNYDSTLSYYESAIKDVYVELLADAGEAGEEVLAGENFDKLNVNDLKAIVEELVDEATIAQAFSDANLDTDYVAEYYTFSWYDSAQYIPFNYETAEAGQTGYSYTATAYSESLVYFRTFDVEANAYNVFVNYSSVDQSFSISSSSSSGSSSSSDGNGNGDGSSQSFWLLISSIILVIVLIFVLVAILVRNLWKKYSRKRGQKRLQKNNYKQRERYIRKLGLVKAAPVEDEPEAPAENTAEAPVEAAPVEEAPAETPAEEAPAEAPAEAETSAEDDKKDE